MDGIMENNVVYKTGKLVGKKYKSGMEFSFELAIPTIPKEKYALLLEHDGLILNICLR